MFKDCSNECMKRNADYFSCNVNGESKFLGEKKFSIYKLNLIKTTWIIQAKNVAINNFCFVFLLTNI